MKKMIAVLLAILLLCSLAACGGGSKDDGTASGNEGAATGGATDGAEGSGAADGYGSDQTLASGFGLFREDFDYSTMPKYKVVGMFNQMNSMYQEQDRYFQIWAERTNCDYSMYDAGGDSDAFITAIETFASQGVDGVIITPDASVMPRVVEVLEENDMTYMTGFSPAVNNANEYQHPFVGTDNYAIGETLGGWLAEYAKGIEGLNMDEVGMVWIDWSTSNEVHLRGIGSWYGWDNVHGNAADVFHYVDGVAEGGMTEEAGYNLVSTLIVANPDIKYWFVATTAETMAFGAARALEDFDLDETSAVVNNGVDSLIKQWDSGAVTCFRAGNAIPNATRTNAYWNCLYAFMAGWATPESIWPDCTPEGETYAYVILNSNMVNETNYKSFFAWADNLIDYNMYNYEWDGTEYEAYAYIDKYPLLWTEITVDPTNGQFNAD